MAAPTWDVFVAHAGADGDLARKLHAALQAHCPDRVFLDLEQLEPGRWDQQLAQAQSDALITAAIVSPHTEAAFYEGEEIARAVALHREDAYRHQVVPVLAGGASWSVRDRPYGTFVLQSLKLDAPNSVEAVAEQLAAWASRMRRALETAQVPPTSVGIPPLVRCFGRATEVGRLAATLIRGSGPVVVLGPPGIGKSTVALAAAHTSEAAARFADRRWLVRLDGRRSADQILDAIAEAVGCEPGRGVDVRLRARLSTAPSLLVLDNAEAAWEADGIAAEAVFALLAALSNVSLAVTLRSGAPPGGPTWALVERIGPLNPEAALALFRAVAGGRLRPDPELRPLLATLDHVPLAVELLAHASHAAPDLATLAERMRSERARLLERLTADSPRLSVGVSVEASWSSVLMTDDARSLLAALSLLPAGARHDHLSALMPERSLAAAARLRQLALAFDVGDRLRVLQPIREYVAEAHAPGRDVEARVRTHYLELVERLGPRIGRPGGAAAVAELVPEVGDLLAVLDRTLVESDAIGGISAALALAPLFLFSGMDPGTLYSQAATAAARAGDALQEARCKLSLGDVALARFDIASAEAAYRDARTLYRQIGDVHGEAHCVRGSATAARLRSDFARAKAAFDEARGLYRKIRDVHGEANCMRGLADVARSRSDYEVATAQYERAYALYRETGDALGEANCLHALGEIARVRSDPSAEGRFEEALARYRRVGDARGEAHCLHGLGDIARVRSDHDVARSCYEQARTLYDGLGDPLGAANCIRGLGEIRLARDDALGAEAAYEEARALYRLIGNVRGEAHCVRGLATAAAIRSDFARAEATYEEARTLYRQIGDGHGEANCVRGLADVAWTQPDSDQEAAHVRYQQALVLYRQVGDRLGQAFCQQGLGDIALAAAETSAAENAWRVALALFESIPEPVSIGALHVRLARATSDAASRTGHLAEARAAWESVDRHDLIAELEGEFDC